MYTDTRITIFAIFIGEQYCEFDNSIIRQCYHFDLQIPSGGMGYFSGCLCQYTGLYSWGQQYSGISNRTDCANLTFDI